MQRKPRFLSLANLGGGAALEMFDYELQRALDNIQDPNTDPKAQRTVNLKLVIKPNEERNFGNIAFTASSKLAPFKPRESQIFIAEEGGKAAASEVGAEHDPNQHVLKDNDGPVVPQREHDLQGTESTGPRQ